MFGPYCKPILATVLSMALGAAGAQDAKEQARTGALADGVSSAVGIVAGVPVNPLLPVVGVVTKAVTFRHAESLPVAERPRAYAMAAAGWQGSAAANACAAVSVLSGGSFLPACIAVGVGWGWKTWTASERERQEAERCAALRASPGKQKARCPLPRQRAAPAPKVTYAKFVYPQDYVAP